MGPSHLLATFGGEWEFIRKGISHSSLLSPAKSTGQLGGEIEVKNELIPISATSQPFGPIRSLITPPLFSGVVEGRPIFSVINHGAHSRRILLSQRQAFLVKIMQRCFPRRLTSEDVCSLAHLYFDLEISLDETETLLKDLSQLQFFGDEPFLSSEQELVLGKKFREESSKVTDRKMSELLRWSKSQVPFYKDLPIMSYAASKGWIETHVPLLSKDEIRKNFTSMANTLSPSAHGEVKWHYSSGTTGDRQQSVAPKLYALGQYLQLFDALMPGQNPFPVASLNSPICSGTECHTDMDLPFEKRWDRLQLHLNSGIDPLRFSDARLENMLLEIKQISPPTVIGNASYLVMLAHYIIKKGATLPSVKAVLVGDEVPSRIHKYWISEAFACPVYEMYGLSELSPVSLECSAGRMHLLEDSMFLEIIDGSGEVALEGALGAITLTTLEKYIMPFLRYQTTDVARAYYDACPCGRHTAIHGLVEGRMADVMTVLSGEAVTPREIDTIVSNVTMELGHYTFLQRHKGEYHLKFTPLPGNTYFPSEQLRDALREKLGKDAKILVEAVKAIYPTSSGKFRLCVPCG